MPIGRKVPKTLIIIGIYYTWKSGTNKRK